MIAINLPTGWQKYLKESKTKYSPYSQIQIQIAALEYFSELFFSEQAKLIMIFLECLEDRDLLAAIASLNGGLLTIQSDNNSNTIVVSNPDPNNNALVQVAQNNNFNNLASLKNPLMFNGVTSINFISGNQDNYFANNTSLPSIQDGSDSRSLVLVGGSGNDNLIGSSRIKSDTFIQDPGGINLIVGGQGSNNLFGGSQTDTIIIGPSFNAVYDILGKNFIIATLPSSSGYLIVNAVSTVLTNNNPDLSIITFFQTAVTNSPTPFIYQRDSNGNGIVYLNPLAQNFSFNVNQFGKTVVINYIDNNGVQTFTIDRQRVQWIASFGTAGNDTFINNTSINNVFYGSGGNDTIIGGFGINVLKGHSGNDYLLARGLYNDLQAGPGNSLLIGSNLKDSFDIFRNNSTGTTINYNVSKYDIIVGVPQTINFVFFLNTKKPLRNLLDNIFRDLDL